MLTNVLSSLCLQYMNLLSEHIDVDKATRVPLDWGTDKQFAGVTRARTIYRYVARVAACGKQFAVGTTTTQEKAARLFDLANWKLAAFIRKPRFNYPDSINLLNDELINTNIPQLHKFYAECARLRPLPADLTEREARERAFQYLLDGKPKVDRTVATSVYTRLTKQLARTAGDAFKARKSLAEMHAKLKLVKLPELERDLKAYEDRLAALNDVGQNLFYTFERHAKLYADYQQAAVAITEDL